MPLDRTLHARLRDFEKSVIMEALVEHQGNRTRAAKQLGISRRTIVNKIYEMKIQLVGVPPHLQQKLGRRLETNATLRAVRQNLEQVPESVDLSDVEPGP